MTLERQQADAGLTKTMLARRASVRSRLVVSLAYALAFSLIGGWLVGLVWLTIYAALQGVEIAVFREARLHRTDVKPWAAAMLGLNNLAYGAIAPMVIWTGGAWGLMCASLFLAGALLNTVLTSRRSGVAFLAGAIPYGGYLILTAILAGHASGYGPAALGFGILASMTLLTATVLWRGARQGMLAQERARDEAERRRREAEKAADAKSAFVAAVSHELRTPISAILAGAEAIGRANSVGDTPAHAALIKDAGEMMRTLLNDLLDLSKMEAGRMSIETITFDLRALIANTVAFWSAEAEAKGLRLVWDGAEPPRWMAGDPTRLRQILNNLLSNAIKFTSSGTVALGLEQEQRGPYWLLRFSVSDTGIGMSEDQIGRLFNAFEQTDLSTARTHGGTGLGLNISRELARLMGGDIEVSSRKDQGSIFTLEVGLVEADEAPADEADGAPQFAAPLRVLVVDDHEVNRRAVALMLEPLGVELHAATSGVEALAILAENPFDVILMDVHMPHMDGREACRQLRGRPGPNQMAPVVACTGSADDDDLAACFAAGMDAHVAKPIDVHILHATLAKVIADSQSPADAQEALIA